MYSFTQEENKKLTEIYPYLLPRNIFTDKVPEDYDYSYIRGQYELPDGWLRLFLLYCKAIRPLLVNKNYLDKFRFRQIKEKYGSMKLYDNFGYPQDMENLEYLYSGYSSFVCQRCGKIAKYSTIGWIEQLCEDCYDPSVNAKKIVKHRITKIKRWGFDGYTTEVLSFKDINKEYMKCMKMADKQFFDYITREENYASKEH